MRFYKMHERNRIVLFTEMQNNNENDEFTELKD